MRRSGCTRTTALRRRRSPRAARGHHPRVRHVLAAAGAARAPGRRSADSAAGNCWKTRARRTGAARPSPPPPASSGRRARRRRSRRATCRTTRRRCPPGPRSPAGRGRSAWCDSHRRAPSKCTTASRSRAASTTSVSSSQEGSTKPASRSGSSSISAPKGSSKRADLLGRGQPGLARHPDRAQAADGAEARPARAPRDGRARAARRSDCRCGPPSSAGRPAGPSCRWGRTRRPPCPAARRPAAPGPPRRRPRRRPRVRPGRGPRTRLPAAPPAGRAASLEPARGTGTRSAFRCGERPPLPQALLRRLFLAVLRRVGHAPDDAVRRLVRAHARTAPARCSPARRSRHDTVTGSGARPGGITHSLWTTGLPWNRSR